MNAKTFAIHLCTFTLLTSLSVACGPEAQDRLGVEGEVCQRDSDCEGTLLCTSRLCAAPRDDSVIPVNNIHPTNNPEPCNPETEQCICDANGEHCVTSNNVNPDLYTCEDLCDHVAQCFDATTPDQNVYDECVAGCRNEFADANEIDRVTSCFLQYSCHQILIGASDVCL